MTQDAEGTGKPTRTRKSATTSSDQPATRRPRKAAGTKTATAKTAAATKTATKAAPKGRGKAKAKGDGPTIAEATTGRSR